MDIRVHSILHACHDSGERMLICHDDAKVNVDIDRTQNLLTSYSGWDHLGIADYLLY